jgi:alpha-N-arabinofuranosidase
MRRDVLEACRRLGPTIIRWPGGTPAGVYHWKEGVGPQAKRVPALATWEPNLIEPYTFGTHEFIDFCGEIGAAPYLNVNVGTGSPEEAANWVEYCNRVGKTRYATLRAFNGHQEPFGVKYWGMGNELYNEAEVGRMNAEQHAQTVIAYVGIMRRVDSDIKIVAGGDERPNCLSDDWNRLLLQNAGHIIDFISMHPYYSEDDHYRLVACPLQAEIMVKNMGELIDKFKTETAGGAQPRRVLIAVDEWDSWHGTAGPYYKLQLSDGLFSAGMFHVFLRNCNRVGMASYCDMVNSDPCGMIVADTNRLYIDPMGLAFELYRHHSGTTVLDVKTEVASYDVGKISGTPVNWVPYLDCVATIDEQRGKLYIATINRHKDQNIRGDVDLRDLDVNKTGIVRELNAPDVTTANDFDSPNEVAVREHSVTVVGPRFEYVFPAHSATLIELSLRS